MSDELAVLMEPVAGGVHAALRAKVANGDTVAVIGAGTMGLVTVAALRHLTSPGSILIGAKYPIQRQVAEELDRTPAEVAKKLEELASRIL